MGARRSGGLTRIVGPLAGAFALAAMLTPAPARAQAIAAIVNGDPITTVEVDEQMKFRRLVKQTATREAALDDLIGDRIKLRAANRAGLDATDSGIQQALNQVAAQAKTSSTALLQDFQRGKLNIDLIRSHIRAIAAWNDLVRARNKALNVSEQDVDAALAHNGGVKGDTDYTLQQIVFVLPVGATPAIIEQRLREAQALRARFTDCASGVPLARALPNVAVKAAITKAETALGENTRKALAQVQKGRLTAPERTASGVEMVAVCNKDEGADTTSLRDNVQSNLVTERLAKESERMYAELRATAVVEKR